MISLYCRRVLGAVILLVGDALEEILFFYYGVPDVYLDVIVVAVVEEQGG